MQGVVVMLASRERGDGLAPWPPANRRNTPSTHDQRNSLNDRFQLANCKKRMTATRSRGDLDRRLQDYPHLAQTAPHHSGNNTLARSSGAANGSRPVPPSRCSLPSIIRCAWPWRHETI